MENKKNREKGQDAISERVRRLKSKKGLGERKTIVKKKKMKKRTTIVDRYIKQVDVYLRVNEKKI